LQAEKALQESEKLFDQIAQNVNEIFFLYDLKSSSILYINEAVEKILGISPAEIQAKKEKLFELVLTEDRERLGISPEWVEKNTKSSIECRVHHADGSLVWIQLRTFPVYNDKNTVFRIAGLAADITLQKEVELRDHEHHKQLQQADKMATIGRLVSGVAHEINNPNNFIMLNAPLLRKAWECALPCIKVNQGETFYIGKMRLQDFSEYIFPLLDGILDGSKRIARIVADLKDYARPEADNTSQLVDFGRVIQSATNLMNNTFVKKNIKVDMDLGTNPVPVRGYAQKLEQVVINLLQNSCDAFTSRDNNLITVNLDTSSSDEVRLYVHDSGCGITPEDLPHIIEPFYTTKRCHGGMGLGLSVSHKILVDHGGQLQFQSEPGKGTTAIIILPKGTSAIC
jgi:PAS domain S-box-containing protein